MRTLSSLGSRSLAHRKGRSALTAIGIALGVSLLFGVLVGNAGVNRGFERFVDDAIGQSDVFVRPVGAFDATMPSSMVGRLAELPDVVDTAPALFRPILLRNGAAEARVGLVGVDLESSLRMFPEDLAEGRRFTPGTPELVLDRRIGEKLYARVGTVLTDLSGRTFTVVGISSRGGQDLGETTDGSATASLDVVSAVAGEPDRVSSVALALRDGVNVDSWIDAHRFDLGTGLDFQNSAAIVDVFRRLLTAMEGALTSVATIAVFIGTFLIYLTLSMAIIERTRMYGTLRALGATRGQIRRVVVTEAVALGAASTVVGLLLGLLIGYGMVGLVTGLIEIDNPGLVVPPGALVVASAVGVLTTVVAALLPARRAARLSPVVAMKGDYRAEARLSRAWVAGAVLSTFGLILTFTSGTIDVVWLGTLSLLIGAVLLVPLVLRPVARALGRLTRSISRGTGDVAVMHLVKERSRSAYTLALIMVVLAMTFALGATNASLARSLDRVIGLQYGADIQIFSAGTFSPEFEEALRAIPEIERITAFRYGRVRVLDPDLSDQLFLSVIDTETYFDIAGFPWSDGDTATARNALATGGSVLIPDTVARQLKKKRGEEITIATTEGPRLFTIAGTYAAFGQGPRVGVVAGLGDGIAFFGSGRPNAYDMNAKSGADVEAVARSVREGLRTRATFVTETSGSIKAEARAELAGFFQIFYAIILITGVVGLLGLANTLAMSVIQRYREIGVLRAVGTLRGQVRRMVVVESSTLAAVAFALAVPLGSILSTMLVRTTEESMGFSIDYLYPWLWLPIIAVLALIVAGLAAVGPARRASGLDVVSALQYE